jgi:hypothetical protein
MRSRNLPCDYSPLRLPRGRTEHCACPPAWSRTDHDLKIYVGVAETNGTEPQHFDQEREREKKRRSDAAPDPTLMFNANKFQ